MIWKNLDPVAADTGMRILPTTTFADCPDLDLLLVPGGAGVNELMGDAETLAFLRDRAGRTRHMASVCTGALVLGAAGLLTERRAGTHWASRHFLLEFGATPVAERAVVDGTLFSGGGVTAGIDIALRIVGDLLGEPMAKAVQLSIEYDPKPPFDCGSPETADVTVVDRVRGAMGGMLEARAAAVRAAAAKLREG